MPNDAVAIFRPLHTAVSKRIRERLVAGQARFFANDNIAAYMMPGKFDELVEEVGA